MQKETSTQVNGKCSSNYRFIKMLLLTSLMIYLNMDAITNKEINYG